MVSVSLKLLCFLTLFCICYVWLVMKKRKGFMKDFVCELVDITESKISFAWLYVRKSSGGVILKREKRSSSVRNICEGFFFFFLFLNCVLWIFVKDEGFWECFVSALMLGLLDFFNQDLYLGTMFLYALIRLILQPYREFWIARYRYKLNIGDFWIAIQNEPIHGAIKKHKVGTQSPDQKSNNLNIKST